MGSFLAVCSHLPFPSIKDPLLFLTSGVFYPSLNPKAMVWVHRPALGPDQGCDPFPFLHFLSSTSVPVMVHQSPGATQSPLEFPSQGIAELLCWKVTLLEPAWPAQQG